MQTLSVILAGGSGTRFWPLSRTNLPKQVLNISGNDVMINETITRCNGIVNFKDSYIVTAENQADIIKDVLLPDVPKENVFSEPAARNTAPCILYAALKLRKKYGDAVMCVFPSDHYITNTPKFREILQKAVALAEENEKLVTIGITPTFPATGYGYINYNKESINGDSYKVNEFVEKPDYIRASEFIKSGNYLWNSGIFIWKISTIISSFERYLPRIYNRMLEWEQYIDTPDEAAMFKKIYPSVQKISIDFGIMERSDDVLVIPADIGWNDVGSWDALGAIFPPDEKGNIIRSEENILINSMNNIVFSEKQLVSAIDIHDMIIVSTADALMICPKSKAQNVKDIVEELTLNKMDKYI